MVVVMVAGGMMSIHHQITHPPPPTPDDMPHPTFHSLIHNVPLHTPMRSINQMNDDDNENMNRTSASCRRTRPTSTAPRRSRCAALVAGPFFLSYYDGKSL